MTSTKKARGIWGGSGYVNDKHQPGKHLSSSQRQRNRTCASVRARVEHIVRTIKYPFGFRKTRYRGREKNAAQVNWLLGLANLSLLRRQLMAAKAESRLPCPKHGRRRKNSVRLGYLHNPPARCQKKLRLRRRETLRLGFVRRFPK